MVSWQAALWLLAPAMALDLTWKLHGLPWKRWQVVTGRLACSILQRTAQCR